MSYIGKTPTSVPLTSSDITDGIITTTKIADDAATADKIANAVNSAITANTSKTTNATHSGEVTGSGALTIADNVVDEANLKVSNSPTNGYFLAAQSGNTGGLTWQEAGGGGKILQLVSTSDATVYSAAPGASFIEPLTSLRAVITPSATNSKIFIILTLPMASGDTGNVASGQLAFDTAGGSANVIVPPNSGHQVDGEYAHFPLPLIAESYDQHSVAYSVLHSPGTTSALTYKFRAKSESSGGDLYINRTARDNGNYDPRSVATITAMEIGA